MRCVVHQAGLGLQIHLQAAGAKESCRLSTRCGRPAPPCGCHYRLPVSAWPVARYSPHHCPLLLLSHKGGLGQVRCCAIACLCQLLQAPAGRTAPDQHMVPQPGCLLSRFPQGRSSSSIRQHGRRQAGAGRRPQAEGAGRAGRCGPCCKGAAESSSMPRPLPSAHRARKAGAGTALALLPPPARRHRPSAQHLRLL